MNKDHAFIAAMVFTGLTIPVSTYLIRRDTSKPLVRRGTVVTQKITGWHGIVVAIQPDGKYRVATGDNRGCQEYPDQDPILWDQD